MFEMLEFEEKYAFQNLKIQLKAMDFKYIQVMLMLIWEDIQILQ